jgi:hypothetical protein
MAGINKINRSLLLLFVFFVLVSSSADASAPFLRSQLITDRIGDSRSTPVIMDVDGDGRKDVIYTDGGKIGWIRNLGNRQFGPKVILQARENWWESYQKVVVADMDGDNKLDLVCDVADADIQIMYNLGGGQFGPGREWYYKTYYGYGADVEDFVVGDFDRDGDNDIIVTTWSGGKIWFQANVEATWSTEYDTWVFSWDKDYMQRLLFHTKYTNWPEPDDVVHISNPRYPKLLVTGNFNNDQWLDIGFGGDRDAPNGYSASLEVMNNVGEEPLAADDLDPENVTDIIFEPGVFVNSMASAQLNSTPEDEIIMSYDFERGLLCVYKDSNTVLGWNWRSIVSESIPATTFCIGDVDHDGDNDVIVITKEFIYGDVRLFRVMINNGNGIFSWDQRPMETIAADFNGYVALEDLDGDGHDDLIYLGRDESGLDKFMSLRVYYNRRGSGEGPIPSVWNDSSYLKWDTSDYIDWWQNEWFGNYKTFGWGQWLYKSGMGWAHPASGNNDGHWFHSPQDGWFWTSEAAWPAVYNATQGKWVI